ncbi:beta-catenin-like protein 1 [Python bivittatus]|uniref:Beta-catenin-like protein 1 n=1 Tax=Python bivittatus TaxID=176946 RepID=A0A9F3QWD8_PYTBI|nr:beta-catenin-like protein 1 [Python bivittatus]
MGKQVAEAEHAFEAQEGSLARQAADRSPCFLLRQVFKRHNPGPAEEQEMMENLFDSLCSSLMLSSNRDRFLKGEGLQLMNLMLREKKISRSSALKVLDHAMIGPEGADNCHKFVDILGLRTIFPLFMKSPKKIKKVGTSEKEHEGRISSKLALPLFLEKLSSERRAWSVHAS